MCDLLQSLPGSRPYGEGLPNILPETRLRSLPVRTSALQVCMGAPDTYGWIPDPAVRLRGSWLTVYAATAPTGHPASAFAVVALALRSSIFFFSFA
jgi:hypothetical protein